MSENRIKQLRLAASFTLDDLVEKLNMHGVTITKQALSNYENGKRVPKPTILMALGKVFHVKAGHVMSEPSVKIEWLSYRCQTALRVRDKEEIQAKAESQAEKYMYLQNLLYPGTKPSLPRKQVSTFKEAEDAASELRNSWRLGDAPIDSLTQTIETQGGVVVEIPRKGVKFDGLSGCVNDCFPILAINTALPDDRIRFNLAHELGHLVMNCEEVEPKFEEKLANRFAASLLAPAEVVFREVGNMRRSFGFSEIGMLKQKYGLSMAAWLIRLYDLEVISQNSFVNAFTEFNQLGWRVKEPVEFTGTETPTRFEQMLLRALSEGVITSVKAEELCPGIIKKLEDKHFDDLNMIKPSDLMKLPYSERRKIIAEMAKSAEKMYSEDEDLKGFDAFGEEDIYD